MIRVLLLFSELTYLAAGVEFRRLAHAPERLRRPLTRDVLNSAKDLVDFDTACREVSP